MSCPNCGLSTANFNCNNHLMQAPGGLLISHARGYQRNDKNVTFLFEEIARLNVLLHEKDKLITTLEGTIDGLNTRMNERDKEIERLKGLMPPNERGPGFVGQGSWSVFAEKVVGERDAALEKVAELKECLRWYVENDDTNEGGDWEESNGFWLRGKRRAMRALGKEEE